jgi:hypothetical protein
MFHTLTFGVATALTRHANCVKKTDLNVTMNIQEACGLIWTYNSPRAQIICLFTMWVIRTQPDYVVGKTVREPYLASTMELNNFLHTMSLLCR